MNLKTPEIPGLKKTLAGTQEKIFSETRHGRGGLLPGPSE